MAKPINPTPTLEGEDMERFIKEVDSNRYNSKKEKILKECHSVYKKVQKDI